MRANDVNDTVDILDSLGIIDNKIGAIAKIEEGLGMIPKDARLDITYDGTEILVLAHTSKIAIEVCKISVAVHLRQPYSRTCRKLVNYAKDLIRGAVAC